MSSSTRALLRSAWRVHRQALLSAGAVIALGTAPAFAQLDSGSGLVASTKVNHVPGSSDYGMAPLPAPEALVPQVNQYLSKYGAAVLLDNVNEFAGIISGPHQESGNSGQYGLEYDQDWYKLAGIPGLETHAIAVGRYGINVGPNFGDTLDQTQEIYGAGGNVAIHLVFFYAEETLAQGRVAVAAGRAPMENDFDSNPLNCNFMNNSLCGNAKGITDNSANASYPDAQWFIRPRIRPIPSVYVQTGIYFTEDNTYDAKNGYRSGFHLDASHINGEAFPIEVGYEPKIGPDAMPGHYKVGFMFENRAHTTWDLPTNTPEVRKGGSQEWLQFDQMVRRQGPGATDGIIVIGNYNHNDPRYSVRQDQFNIAAIDRDFWKARPLDTIGVLFNYQSVSSRLSRIQSEEIEFGLPVSGGDFGTFPGAQGVQNHVLNVELNYQIHVFRGVTFAPDFQYFIRPNGQGNLPDAAVVGFKTHIQLF